MTCSARNNVCVRTRSLFDYLLNFASLAIMKGSCQRGLETFSALVVSLGYKLVASTGLATFGFFFGEEGLALQRAKPLS
eukprot:3766543-Amphidinium_carterae.1